MNLKDFKDDLESSLKKLKFHESIGIALKFLSFGLITNEKKIEECREKLERSKSDFEKYKMLIKKAIKLDKSLETIVIEGARISKHTFSDLPVVGKEDYGINWEYLREHVLSRDNYECQESDGYCFGPLQIHHSIPLSKGGSNNLKNLQTLCFYHHSLKHEHMSERLYGNIWN